MQQAKLGVIPPYSVFVSCIMRLHPSLGPKIQTESKQFKDFGDETAYLNDTNSSQTIFTTHTQGGFTDAVDVFANFSPCRPEKDSNSLGSKFHQSSYYSTRSGLYFCCFYCPPTPLVIKACVLKVFPSSLFAAIQLCGRPSGVNRHKSSVIFCSSPQSGEVRTDL